jgi:hypothetical protein
MLGFVLLLGRMMGVLLMRGNILICPEAWRGSSYMKFDC